ncbi:MAG: polyphosphate polymerase domain-containing protein [Bacilli bacterium]|jgi:hypothetical protein|nr:polyphosphate polymerase domain-containing protein [Bacilli bacterium]MCH4228484.1 polyphosphate polymerase domain-containing protein [Bacilli bacterium]MCI2054919.1 polyphosphate polymerase domain-containing protein [Bacilli bacterium]
MLNTKVSFCRIENKYVIKSDVVPFFEEELKKHMEVDPYALNDGHYQVNTIYFDDASDNVVARSISHPDYKEKLRLRSYGGTHPIFFIEFKNKFGDQVYKVRIILSEEEYENIVFHNVMPSKNGEYAHDRFIDLLDDFSNRHGGITPKSLIQYERSALINKPDDQYLRATIDSNLIYRRDDFTINKLGGKPLVPSSSRILEVKIERALPLWLAHLLNQYGIYRDRFSKYGASFIETREQSEPSLSLEASFSSLAESHGMGSYQNSTRK